MLGTLSGRSAQTVEPATARLQDAARHAVERLKERGGGARLYAIVTRCDVGGEAHKAVSADLGLSRRQFYRDLASARHAVAQEIRGEVVRVADPASAIPFAAQLQTAATLAAAGHRRVAYRAFEPVATLMSGGEAVWGRCVLAEFLLQEGDVAGADRELERARQECSLAENAGSEHVLLAEASRSFESGRMTETVRILQSCIAHVEATRARSPLAVETLSRALTLLAFCHQARGEFHAASAAHARNPAGSGAGLSAMAQIEYLNVNAMLACDGPAGPAGARPACDAFYAFAAGHGFLEDISVALLQKGGIARMQRRLKEAELHARESLEIHRAIGRPATPMLSLLSGIAVDRGDAIATMSLARRMRTETHPRTRAWLGSHLYEAEALTQLGRFDEARRSCDGVEREVDERDARVTGWLRRLEAAALDGLGDRRAAVRSAGVALELLGEDAPPFHRLKTLMVVQHIQPSRKRRTKMRELADLLGWRQQREGAPSS